MTLPAKGTRKLAVGGKTFRWRVSVDEDVEFLYPAGGAASPVPAIDAHSLVVEHSGFPGQTLTVAFDFAGRQEVGIPITPGLVSAVIAVATEKGWPDASASPTRLFWKSGLLMTRDQWMAARRAEEQ